MCNQSARYLPLDSTFRRHRFSPVVRIRTAPVYQRTLRTKKAASNNLLELFCYGAGYHYPRLGIIVGKRMLKKAVDRNYVKRIVRESFRHLTGQLVPKDYVIRLRFTPAFDRSALPMIRKDVDHLFAKFLKEKSLPL